jgi:hypothetical protein
MTGGDTARPGAPGPDSPVTSTPVDPTMPIPSPSPRMVEPVPNLRDVRPVPWEKAEPLGPRTLLVSFYSGVHQCYGVDRVDVEYTPEQVVVTLFVGRHKDAQICVEIAEYQAIEVELDEPLGGRKIVDGAA